MGIIFFDDKRFSSKSSIIKKVESWSSIDEYFNAFLSIHSAMMDSQSSKLSISEFFVRCIQMKLEIEDVPAGD